MMACRVADRRFDWRAFYLMSHDNRRAMPVVMLSADIRARYNWRMNSSRLIHRLTHPVTLIVLLAITVGAGLWTWQRLQASAPPSLMATTVYPEPVRLEPFELTDSTGTAVTPDQFRDHWDVLFFGFTHCPDICPSTLSMLSSVEKRLSRSHPDHPVRFWFVSVDPERDTPAVMSQYAGFFNPAFRAMTGSDAELRKLTAQLSIAYEIEAHDPGQDQYAVDHSSALIVIDPESRLYGVMTTPHQPARILTDLTALATSR